MMFFRANHTSRYMSNDDVVQPGDETRIDCKGCQSKLVAYLLEHDLV